MQLAATTGERLFAAFFLTNPMYKIDSNFSTEHFALHMRSNSGSWHISLYVVSPYLQCRDDIINHITQLNRVVQALREERVFLGMDRADPKRFNLVLSDWKKFHTA